MSSHVQDMRFSFGASQPARGRSHVGVVASGDLELIMEAIDAPLTTITVCTNVSGFELIWAATLERFSSRSHVQVNIEINDFGATPGMVLLRLQQALERMGEEE